MTKTFMGESEKTALVYILAASHSGSTLLAMLLGSHPDICTVGELKFTSLGDADLYRCSCREEIGKCAFWRGVGEEMASRGLSFDVRAAGTDYRSGADAYVRRLLRPLHRGPALEWVRDAALSLSGSWRSAYPEIQRRNAALAASICARTAKRVIVDSSKVGVRLKYLLRNPGLDVRVIRMIRDGRGVALTYTDPARFADAEDPTLRGGGAGTDRSAERQSIEAAAREWLRSNQEAEAILRRLAPERWIEVRYEDLCTDPSATLGRLFRYIGVGPAPIADFRAMEHHVVGNGMRFDSTSEIRLDERWRTTFGARELKEFVRLAGHMNSRMGYR